MDIFPESTDLQDEDPETFVRKRTRIFTFSQLRTLKLPKSYILYMHGIIFPFLLGISNSYKQFRALSSST